jgi:MoaA/NifB/PqqE/SkfB family radical SAM enzyme
VNDVNGWGFDEETIASNTGNLLTLDIDFGSRCSLNCPFCFRKDNSVDSNIRELHLKDLVRIVTEGKKLGLRSVKLLGAGEPLENPGILDFLRLLQTLDIVPVLFSKTGVLGDDQIAEYLFSQYGIHSAMELVKEIEQYGASVVVGLNSFEDEIQSQMVGDGSSFIDRRNRTLENLVKAGFNSSNPTRLAIGVNPVTKWNIGEAFKIYKWARVRNIYAIVTPTMISGRTKGNMWKTINPSEDELMKLYTDIYCFNIETNLMTLEQIIREGISAYAGGRPCNQVAVGLYVTLNGIVLSCPGSEENVEGNVWESSLSKIWFNSKNFARKGTYNCKCIAKDGKSISNQLYQEVICNLNTRIHSRCARKTTKIKAI